MSMIRSAFAALLLLAATLGCIGHGPMVPPPVRELWPAGACRTAISTTEKPGFDTKQMYDLAAEAIAAPGASAPLRGAFAYARDHCYPLWFGNADRRALTGDFEGAFFLYHLDIFPGESTFAVGPPFDAMDIRSTLEAALKLGESGRYGDAAIGFRKVVRSAPNFPDAHYFLGNALLALHRRVEARSEWLAALRCRGTVVTNKRKIGPDDAWLSALLMYETVR